MTTAADKDGMERNMCEALDTEPPISELFYKVVAFADALGVSNINELPGCWEATADEHRLSIAVNGHGEAKTTTDGFDLEPFHAFIKINGWPAAVVSPFGGTVVGGSEDDLIALIEAATASRKVLS